MTREFRVSILRPTNSSERQVPYKTDFLDFDRHYILLTRYRLENAPGTFFAGTWFFGGNMNWLKLTLSFAIAVGGFSSGAQVNDQVSVKSCLKSEYDPTPDQVSCVDIYSSSPGSYHLTAMNKAGHIITEARITPMINSDKKEQLIKYEILPLNPTEPILEWEILNIKNQEVLYSTLAKQDKLLYRNILLSEHNLVTNRDQMPIACKDAILFCTGGAIVTGFTLIAGVIAVPGCALEIKKCQEAKAYLGIK